MSNISDNITYSEATRSRTAIKNDIENKPNATQLSNMRYVAINIFEKAREHFGVPILVTSFFRSILLNFKIHGSSTSQHMKGEAIDVDDRLGGVTNSEIFYFIVDNLEFDQIVWEFGNESNPDWVHFSLKQKGINRGKITIAYKKEGETEYKSFYSKDKFNEFKYKLYN